MKKVIGKVEKLIERNDLFLKNSDSDLEFILNCRSLTNNLDQLFFFKK